MVGPLNRRSRGYRNGLCTELVLLLRLRWQSYANAIRDANPAHRWVGGILGAGACAIFGVILVVFAALLVQVKKTVGPSGVDVLVSETVRYLFLFLVAGGVPFVSGVLFSPGDLLLLAAAPIRPAVMVLARLFDSVVVASAQFIVIGVPLLVACAWISGVSPAGWIGFALLLASFLALPALLAAILLLSFARLAGLRRVRAVVAVTSAVFAVTICLLVVTAISRRTSAQNGPTSTGITALIDPSFVRSATGNQEARSPLMPSTWMTNGLLGLAGRNVESAAIGAADLIGGTAVLAWLCVILGGPVLVGEGLLEGDAGGSGASQARRLQSMLSVLPISPPVRAIIVRDLLSGVRDIVLLSQVGIPLILYLVPFVIGSEIGASGQSSDMAGFSLAVVGTVAFMETSILSLSSIGLEGTGFWMVLTAPVTAGQLLSAKWLGAWSGSLAITLPLFFVTCLYYHLALEIDVMGFGIVLVTTACLCGFGVGLSGLFPRFVYDNPAHRASIAALVWGFVGSTLYVMMAGIPLGAALYLAPGTPEWAAQMITGGVGWFLLLSVITAAIPLGMARARLTAYAWEA